MSKTILRHTALFSGFVFLAQVLGLVRDLYLVRVFGVSQVLDTYYLAFKIPDFLNVFYSVFLGSVIFIPLLTNAKKYGGEDDNKNEISKKINTIGSLVLTLLLFFSVLIFILLPYLSNFLAPNFSADQKQLLVNLSRILLVGQFFFPVGILAGCIGMIYKKPFYMAISGFIYNLFILIGAYFLVPVFGIYGLVYSVVIAAFCFMLVQVLPKEAIHYLKNFKYKIDLEDWKKFIYKNMSRFFAVFAYQAYSLLILALAGLSGPGSVTSFTIAYNVYLAAFFIIGASFSTALLPKISLHHTLGEGKEQKENLQKTLFITFLMSFVAAVLLYSLSVLIIQTLYYFSSLTYGQEIYIASLLSLLSFSFPFFNILEIMRKYLYATDQIFFAGTITVFLLASLCLFTFLLNSFSSNGILLSLIHALNISLFLTNFIVLVILKNKNQI